jgi:integrase
MKQKRTDREIAVKGNVIEGVHRNLIRIPSKELRELNRKLPTGIRVLQNGNYQARFRDANKKEVSRTFKTRRQAEDWRNSGLQNVKTGDWTDPKAGREHLESFYNIYRSDKATTLKASSLADIEYLWDTYVHVWGNREVAKIQSWEIEDWTREMSSNGYSASVIRRCYLILSGALDIAVRKSAISKNPVDTKYLKKLLPKASTHQPNPLTRDQSADLLDKSSITFRDLTEAIILTGMRFSEAREIRVKDVHLRGQSSHGLDYGQHPMLSIDRACVSVKSRGEDNKVVYQPDTPQTRIQWEEAIDSPKSGPRQIPLTPRGISLFKKLIKGRSPDELLFLNSDGNRVQHRGFSSSLRDAATRAGIETASGQNITPHSLRDTFATNALLSGASIKAVQKAMGHSTPQMLLQRYVGWLPEDTESLRSGLAEAQARQTRKTKGRQHMGK